MSVYLEVEITVDTLVRACDALTPEDLIALIKELDAKREDWDVTLLLCEHFEKLREIYKREEEMCK